MGDDKVRSVPPDDSEPQTPDNETAPESAEGPPPSQDEPPAPGGRIPPRDEASGT